MMQAIVALFVEAAVWRTLDTTDANAQRTPHQIWPIYDAMRKTPTWYRAPEITKRTENP